MKKQSKLTVGEIRDAIIKARLRKDKNTNIVKNLRRDLARALTYAKS
ncbi:MAG: hypothetical protein M1484_05290 [Patescibacteria group bacterium]|nr:hypothetical protein [Patescibacteria group bacterium]MCL5432469.1 hypothetical protein [Patescibacteria group bacterium]